MDEFLGMSGTTWTGIYTIITFCLLVVAVAAALYARKQWKEARGQVEEARTARLEASRPYVIVTVEPSGSSQQLFDLVVKNIGLRPAMNVSVMLDPAPKRARESAGREIAKAKMLNEPIALIAPGQEMRAFYDNQLERTGRDDLPTSHLVSLSYRDSSEHVYSETSVLDLEAMKGTMFASVRTLHDIGKTLDKIQKTLSDASVLHRSGKIQTETSVESRTARLQRLDKEAAQIQAQQSHLMNLLGFGDQNQIPNIDSENSGSDPKSGPEYD